MPTSPTGGIFFVPNRRGGILFRPRAYRAPHSLGFSPDASPSTPSWNPIITGLPYRHGPRPGRSAPREEFRRGIFFVYRHRAVTKSNRDENSHRFRSLPPFPPSRRRVCPICRERTLPAIRPVIRFVAGRRTRDSDGMRFRSVSRYHHQSDRDRRGFGVFWLPRVLRRRGAGLGPQRCLSRGGPPEFGRIIFRPAGVDSCTIERQTSRRLS